jgi:hypothetical protein
MSCGCKNKPNQTPPPPPSSQQSQPTTPQKPSANIQESIKKVVEKYYNKK